MSCLAILTTIAPDEIETICFDFGLLIQDGAPTIVSASLTCSVIYGADATPTDRLIGTPIVSASRETGAASASVLHQVGTMIASVTYLLRCSATISDGQKLDVTARLTCAQPA